MIPERERHLYSPWYSRFTKDARKKPKPYTVVQMTYHDFKDYTCSAHQSYKSIRPGQVKDDPTVINLRALRYNSSGVIPYKLQFDDEWWELPQRLKSMSGMAQFIFWKKKNQKWEVLYIYRTWNR